MKTTKIFLAVLLCLLSGMMYGQSSGTPERTPSNRTYYEFETLRHQVYGGRVVSQTLPDFDLWSSNAHSWWTNGRINNSVQYFFDVASAGNHYASMQYTVAPDYSLYDVYVNDVYQTTVDGYSPTLGIASVSLPDANFVAGENKISFVFVGKNKSATNRNVHMAGFDYLTVEEGSSPYYGLHKAYLIGSAIVGVEWDLSKAEMISDGKSGTGNMFWKGYLKEGEFKLLQLGSSWAPSINPYQTQEVVSGETYDVRVTDAKNLDYKFVIKKKGYYRIDFNSTQRKLTVTEENTHLPIYLLGDATSAGWDNSKPIEMAADLITGTVYEWTGPLKKGHFKFITTPGTWESLVPNTIGHTDIKLGYTYQMTDDYKGDYRFVIKKDGDYKITVTHSPPDKWSPKHGWFLVVTPVNTVEEQPLNIYLLGDATEVGWDNTRAIEMRMWKNENDSSYEYIIQAYLKPGHFKFITELGTWKSLVPEHPQNENIIHRYYHRLSDVYQGDYRFVVNEEGYYLLFITVDKYKNMRMQTILEYPTPDMGIFIVGDATPTGWDISNPGRLGTDGEMWQWSGDLKPGHFKFITYRNTWNSLVPAIRANQEVTDGGIYNISCYYQGDYRFVIKEAGHYSIVIDAIKRTLKVVKFGPPSVRANTANLFEASSVNGCVQVKAGRDVAVQTAQLFNLTGRAIDMRQNVKGDFTLGSGLPAGVYIVKIVYDDNQVFTEKVNVR